MYRLLEPLEILFNSSISQGVFPRLLKTSVIVPIYKSGGATDLTNYKPIAILSVISKIFELVVKNRVMAFLTCKNFFSERQFGFLPGRSTDDALMSHITGIINHTERGSITVALYLDICKVFDTVDHDILLEKIQNYGSRGILLDWFSTYLKGRYQVVRIGEKLSCPLKLQVVLPREVPGDQSYFSFMLMSCSSSKLQAGFISLLMTPRCFLQPKLKWNFLKK